MAENLAPRIHLSLYRVTAKWHRKHKVLWTSGTNPEEVKAKVAKILDIPIERIHAERPT